MIKLLTIRANTLPECFVNQHKQFLACSQNQSSVSTQCACGWWFITSLECLLSSAQLHVCVCAAGTHDTKECVGV